ncbi:hypothetical protein AB0B79_39415 [Streptomyces sp. NPDC039022]|uniref:hypothetical protein n=1 Tax=Streptomyces sp. NPDC039022 TaxID=3157091 RepID=UPI0033C7AEBB
MAMTMNGQAAEGGKNTALAAALQNAGCSYQSLAARVNALARRQGRLTRYDKASVSRWVGGRPPRAETMWLVAGALTEALGRVVQPCDIGFHVQQGPPVVVRSLLYGEDVGQVLQTLSGLAAEDVGRRDVLGAVPFVSSALLAPQRSWLLWAWEQSETPALAAVAAGGRVAVVQAMVAAFDRVDNRFGGQEVRSSILFYLNREVLPMLRQGVGAEERGPLFTAAARLGAMAGWSSYDSGEYGLAQRYMIQALRLCQEGGDLVLAGQVLAGLSHLSTSLGHPEDGVHLARAGLQTARHAGSPLGLMRLQAMVARGCAASGRAKQALRALEEAEAALGRSRGAEQESPWVRYLDRHYWEAEAAFVFRDLGRAEQAEQMADASVRANGDRRRRQAISQAVLAGACLQQGRLDEALACAHAALKGLENVRSLRSVQALKDFGQRAGAFGKEPAVRAFFRAAQPVLETA